MPVLFEEADGVFISLQGKDRKQCRQDKAEMKVTLAYDGWKKTGKDWYILPEKVVVAGFAKEKEFHEYREAATAERYNLDEVSQRILNADGASWIKKVKDKSTCFQLDPFHRNKAVKEKIHNQKAVHEIMELLEEEKTEELFLYLKMYRDSLWEEREIEDAEELIRQMFLWFQVTEERLCTEKEIATPVDTLRWDYYQYVREHPVCNWSIATSILYGGKDNMQSAEVVQKFAQEYSCNLMVSQESEHAFMQDGDRSIVEKRLEKNL